MQQKLNEAMQNAIKMLQESGYSIKVQMDQLFQSSSALAKLNKERYMVFRLQHENEERNFDDPDEHEIGLLKTFISGITDIQVPQIDDIIADKQQFIPGKTVKSIDIPNSIIKNLEQVENNLKGLGFVESQVREH